MTDAIAKARKKKKAKWWISPWISPWPHEPQNPRQSKNPADLDSAGFSCEVPSRFELENKGFAVVPRPFSALFSDCEKSPEALIYKAKTSHKIQFHFRNPGAIQGEKRGSKHQNKRQDFRLFRLESTRFVWNLQMYIYSFSASNKPLFNSSL